MSAPVVALTLAAAVGSGAVGGVFFAFSTFVMQALRRLPAAQGAAAMQAINVTAVRPPLMLALFGTAALCLVLVVVAAAQWGEPFAPWLLAGAVVYVVGAPGVTIVRNVPRNEALARLEGDEAAAYWPTYAAEWTAGNHARTLAGLAAAGLFALALT